MSVIETVNLSTDDSSHGKGPAMVIKSRLCSITWKLRYNVPPLVLDWEKKLRQEQLVVLGVWI